MRQLPKVTNDVTIFVTSMRQIKKRGKKEKKRKKRFLPLIPSHIKEKKLIKKEIPKRKKESV